MRPRVVITRKLPEAVEHRAASLFEIAPNPQDRPYLASELIALCSGADGLLCSPTEAVGGEVVAALPSSLRIVATYSAGTDHLDLAALAARGIAVTNTPDVLTDATADIAMLLMLGAARCAWHAQTDLRAGRWKRWAPTEYLGKDLARSRLGLVGMGRIAQATARRARGFGMELCFWNRSAVALPDDLRDVRQMAKLDEVFATSDIVSLHVAGTPETAGLVDARRLSLLPPDAILINTARGSLVDDDALIAALASRRLFAAGLDVFQGEPALDPRYFDLPNAYLLPHIGSATRTAREAMGMRAIDNLATFFSGSPPSDLVNSAGR